MTTYMCSNPQVQAAVQKFVKEFSDLLLKQAQAVASTNPSTAREKRARNVRANTLYEMSKDLLEIKVTSLEKAE